MNRDFVQTDVTEVKCCSDLTDFADDCYFADFDCQSNRHLADLSRWYSSCIESGFRSVF